MCEEELGGVMRGWVPRRIGGSVRKRLKGYKTWNWVCKVARSCEGCEIIVFSH